MPNRWNRKLVRFVLFGSPLILAGCASGTLTEGLIGSASDMTPLIPDLPPVEASAVESLDHGQLMGLAQQMRANGDVAGAAHFYAQAHKANRDDVAALIGLGDMLAALGDSVSAADAYGQATTLQPAQPEARMGLAKASIAMDKPQVAATQFQAVLSANDQDIRAHNGLGVAADLMGDHKAAQGHYRDGLAIDPQNVALLNNLGLSLALSGDFDNGVFMLEELAAAPDASPTTRQNLALAYGLAGRDEESERVARVDLDEAAIRRNMDFIASHRGADSSTELANALKVELASVDLATGPAVVPPSQVAALQQQAAAREAEASASSAEASDNWYYEEPVIEPSPAVAVEIESLSDAERQLAAATEVDTARAMRGLAVPQTMVAAAMSVLPMPSARPAPEARDGEDEPVLAVIDLPAPAPEDITIVETFDEPVAVETVGKAVVEAPMAEASLGQADAPAAEPVTDLPVAGPAAVTAVARAVPVSAGAVPRALLAMPVAAVMAKAPTVTTAIVPTTVTVYDAVPAAEYCRDADVGAVNCLTSLSSGQTRGAVAISAAFSFAMN